MKYTLLAAVFCIGLLAWYHLPDPLPPDTPRVPAGRSVDDTNDGPERFAVSANDCEDFIGTVEWKQLGDIYAGMSDAALCDFVQAPDLAKLDGINVDPAAAETLLNRWFSQHDQRSQLAAVPDLRYYLDPQAIGALRGLSTAELVDKVNNERSPEAAYLLAEKYQEDEQTYVMLMLSAASYAQKPGPLLNAINGCCKWSPNDAEAERSAAIKREALTMIARQMQLPEAAGWPQHDLDSELEAAVLAQRAAYVQELNQYSLEAFGEEWVR